MNQDPLAPLSLEGYLVFFGAMAVLIFGLLCWMQGRDKQARNRFFDQFDAADLRMSPHKVGLVYKVVDVVGLEATVVPVWDGKAAIIDGAERCIPEDKLMPFDRSRFFA